MDYEKMIERAGEYALSGKTVEAMRLLLVTITDIEFECERLSGDISDLAALQDQCEQSYAELKQSLR